MSDFQDYKRVHTISQLAMAAWLDESKSPGLIPKVRQVIDAYQQERIAPDPETKNPAERFFRWPVLPAVEQFVSHLPEAQQWETKMEMLQELCIQLKQAEQNPKQAQNKEALPV